MYMKKNTKSGKIVEIIFLFQITVKTTTKCITSLYNNSSYITALSSTTTWLIQFA